MEPIKDAFHRLIRFGDAAKERALPVWRAAVSRSRRFAQRRVGERPGRIELVGERRRQSRGRADGKFVHEAGVSDKINRSKDRR
jgi:hypothetical protein